MSDARRKGQASKFVINLHGKTPSQLTNLPEQNVLEVTKVK